MPQYGSYPSGAPAQLADKALFQRSGPADKTLTVQDILTAANVLGSDAPAALTDLFAMVRSGAAGSLTLNDVLTLFLNSSPPPPSSIVNGAFRVNQRGTTSQALTNSIAYGAVDAWCFAMSGTAAGVAQQQASSMLGGHTSHRLRLARNSAATSTGTLTGAHVMETVDVVPLQGQTVTFSWDAAGGAQFSPASGAYTFKLWYGTGTDQGSASYYAGTWTGQSAAGTVTKNLTPGANAVRHSLTVSVPATATELALEFTFVPTGTAGADDALYIGRVKYDLGSIAAPPVLRPIAEEVLLCQRRLPAWVAQQSGERAQGAGIVGNTCGAPIWFRVPARVPPTGILLSAAGDFSVYRYAGNNNLAVTGISLQVAGINTAMLLATVASGITQGDMLLLTPTSSTAFLLFTGAEL